MTEPLPLPGLCAQAMDTVQEDPLDPGPAAEAHMKACRACSEARVAYLALEESPEALAPAGYFDHLPHRILRKLPARPRRHLNPLAWSAAAALLLAVGSGAFWIGRANREPIVEAALPRPAEVTESTIADAPFLDREEENAQLHALSPEEMKALLKRLDQPQSTQR